MRKEIEYHSMFLPNKRQITKDEKANELSYVTYSEAANEVTNQQDTHQNLFVNNQTTANEEPKKEEQNQQINNYNPIKNNKIQNTKPKYAIVTKISLAHS